MVFFPINIAVLIECFPFSFTMSVRKGSSPAVYHVTKYPFVSFLSSSAQRERPHAIPQTAECTDSTGLPQTPAGMTHKMIP